MGNEIIQQQNLKSLEPLFVKAESEKLWFYCSGQDLWLSPNELKEKQTEGKFIWGAENWELKDPNEEVCYLEKKQKKIVEQIDKLKVRIGIEAN